MKKFFTHFGSLLYRWDSFFPYRFSEFLLNISLSRIILDHVKKQVVSLGFGGMALMRDLASYKEFTAKFECEVVTEKFEILRDVANIHMVPSGNLQSLMEESSLSKMDKEELLSIIRSRADSNNSFNQSSWYEKLGLLLQT